MPFVYMLNCPNQTRDSNFFKNRQVHIVQTLPNYFLLNVFMLYINGIEPHCEKLIKYTEVKVFSLDTSISDKISFTIPHILSNKS